MQVLSLLSPVGRGLGPTGLVGPWGAVGGHFSKRWGSSLEGTLGTDRRAAVLFVSAGSHGALGEPGWQSQSHCGPGWR